MRFLLALWGVFLAYWITLILFFAVDRTLGDYWVYFSLLLIPAAAIWSIVWRIHNNFLIHVIIFFISLLFFHYLNYRLCMYARFDLFKLAPEADGLSYGTLVGGALQEVNFISVAIIFTLVAIFKTVRGKRSK